VRGLVGWWKRSASDAWDQVASVSRAGRITANLVQQCREPSFWDAVRMTSDRNGGGNAEAPPHVLLAYGLPSGGLPAGTRGFAARGPVVLVPGGSLVVTAAWRGYSDARPLALVSVNQKPFSGLPEGANSAPPDHMNRQRTFLTAVPDPWQGPSPWGHTLRAIHPGTPKMSLTVPS
jgi:hypothetical protein